MSSLERSLEPCEMKTTDVIVVGLGAVGSAAAWRLAARGRAVIGFDRWSPPHTRGSTHAESRITRETAWEGAHYVPLVQRANALFRQLEIESGERLFEQQGGLFLGRREDPIIAGSQQSAAAHGLQTELLEVDAIRERWPHLSPDAGMVGLVDPGAGVLYPERIVRAAHARARALGAELRYDEPMLAWRAEGTGVVVTTPQGEYRADRLVLCTGAWMPELLGPLGVTLDVERITLHWFEPSSDPAQLGHDRVPVQLICPDGAHPTAIFPAIDGAVKATGHHSGAFCTPDSIDRTVHPSEIAEVDALLRRYAAPLSGAWLRSATCMYTNTPSGHFLLDHHPEVPQVILGSPCNGFGFKFSTATGEILADLAVGATSDIDPSPWRFPV